MSALAFTTAGAQIRNPPPQDIGDDFAPQTKRPKLLDELGLSREQVQQIRRINQERKPFMQEARRRLDEANRALDEAIYGDNIASDAEIQSRMREVQQAHAEVIKNRTISETAIRRVLTPAQVGRFRQLRQEFKPQNDGPPAMRPNNRQPNPNRLKNLPKRGILRPRQQIP